MSYQSEFDLENSSIKSLEALGWGFVAIPDEEALKKNFREQVNLFNAKNLKGRELSDKEFKQLYNIITGHSIFNSALLLRETHQIQRDDNSIVSLQLFNQKDWCKNQFQVTHQTRMEGKAKNRYDITLLINGIPIGQLELKRSGGSYKEAFNQIERYRRESFHGLYNFLEILMFSDKMNTRYFANNDGKVLYSQTFHWADEHNKKINYLEDFINSFLSPCHFAKIVARYTVLRSSESKLMVMRPYQIEAVERVVKQALDSGGNGYVWHTTGSGKTLTAFKIGEILSKRPKFAKTIVLVDRADLDNQTVAEFNAFSKDSVDPTDNTKALIKDLLDPSKKLIVTTIQKLNHALKNPKTAKLLQPVVNSPAAFLVDECHRSQLGEMHKLIKKSFAKGQYFGFTGTPIFKENKPAGQEFGTADLFDKVLHTYLLPNAIQDKNVLGFEVSYFDTVGTLSGNNDLIDKVDNSVPATFRHPSRIEEVAKEIIRQHDQNTFDRQYCALFATDSVASLILYYDAFRRLQKSSSRPLRIAALFFYTANEDMEGKQESAKEAQNRIISDYNNVYKTNYSTETFNQYSQDVAKKLKSGEIDIVIVVDMLLTGFDSKLLNTLYVDKNLRHHGLVQAFSRTNRVELARKQYGLIRCFRPLKANVDEAVKLFSQSEDADIVLARPYAEHKQALKEAVSSLRGYVANSQTVDELYGENAQAEFVEKFQRVASLINTMRPYIEFDFDTLDAGITEQEFLDYRSKYLNLYERVQSEPPSSGSLSILDFSIEEVLSDTINVDYIMELLSMIDLSDDDSKARGIQHITENLTRSDSPEVLNRKPQIEQFLSEIVPTLGPKSNIESEFSNFQNESKNREIEAYASTLAKRLSDSTELTADEFSATHALLKAWVSDYEFTGTIDLKTIMDNLKVGLLTKNQLKKEIVKFIKELSRKY